jgi:hypothetical protein
MVVPEVDVRDTQRKGDRATARAIASFTAMEGDVSIPLTESAAYDLVVGTGGALFRVQCKYISGRQVDLRRIRSNGRGFVVKHPAAGAYDWLYVLNAAGQEFLVQECLSGRRAFNPGPQHLLGAVAESG